MDVKVKHTQWLHLMLNAMTVVDKQFLAANFEYSNYHASSTTAVSTTEHNKMRIMVNIMALFIGNILLSGYI